MSEDHRKVLVTGAAGFLGFHLARRLLAAGLTVTGLDSLNRYYDPRLKRARLALLTREPRFEFHRLDLARRAAAEAFFGTRRFDAVVHLAAQAGVRYSIDHPHEFAGSNVTGFLNVLEGARRGGVPHLLYASSSSVYGSVAPEARCAVTDRCDRPLSFYAATKRANELMAHAYTHLYGIPTSGLRFFTVYGPWGRPDMAPYRFARAIARGRSIDIYNYGRLRRDFTYVDDAVEAMVRLLEQGPDGYRLFNIGGGAPVGLMEFVHALERALGRRARRRFVPMQAGDVGATHADSEDLVCATGFRPQTPLDHGVERLVEWCREWWAEKLAARETAQCNAAS